MYSIIIQVMNADLSFSLLIFMRELLGYLFFVAQWILRAYWYTCLSRFCDKWYNIMPYLLHIWMSENMAVAVSYSVIAAQIFSEF